MTHASVRIKLSVTFLSQILTAEMKEITKRVKEMGLHGRVSLCVCKRHKQRVSGSDKYAVAGHIHIHAFLRSVRRASIA